MQWPGPSLWENLSKLEDVISYFQQEIDINISTIDKKPSGKITNLNIGIVKGKCSPYYIVFNFQKYSKVVKEKSFSLDEDEFHRVLNMIQDYNDQILKINYFISEEENQKENILQAISTHQVRKYSILNQFDFWNKFGNFEIEEMQKEIRKKTK